jgi:hypothetical protein
MGIETLRRTSLAVCLLLIPWGTCGKGSIHNAHCIRPSVSLHAVHRPCWHSGQRYPSLIKCRSHLALFMRTQLYLGHQNASDYRFLQPVKPWGNSQIKRSVRHPRQARDHQPLPRFKRKHIDTRPRLHERSLRGCGGQAACPVGRWSRAWRGWRTDWYRQRGRRDMLRLNRRTAGTLSALGACG